MLFATTNHIERLDPALSRPGRMDVWVNFKNATRWQAEGIFKCFFPSKPAATPSGETSSPQDSSQRNLPIPKRKQSSHAVPLLEEAEISELAKRFADAIPDDEMSVSGPFPSLGFPELMSLTQVASLQGYLLKNKTRPRECVDEVAEWYVCIFGPPHHGKFDGILRILQERETRIRLKREKEEVSLFVCASSCRILIHDCSVRPKKRRRYDIISYLRMTDPLIAHYVKAEEQARKEVRVHSKCI